MSIELAAQKFNMSKKLKKFDAINIDERLIIVYNNIDKKTKVAQAGTLCDFDKTIGLSVKMMRLRKKYYTRI